MTRLTLLWLIETLAECVRWLVRRRLPDNGRKYSVNLGAVARSKDTGGIPGYDVAKAGMIRMTTRLASLAEPMVSASIVSRLAGLRPTKCGTTGNPSRRRS